MPEPDKPLATTGDDESTPSADSGAREPEVFAIGPVPAIYVRLSPEQTNT